MRYYISDLHFFHEKLLQRMDCRGFGSLQEMHDYMIQKWNAKVRKKDEVVILGDFSLGKAGETIEILQELKGKKFMIEGNHDWFLKEKDFDSSLFEWVKSYREIHDNKRKIVLSHFPIMCYNGQYRRDSKGNATSFMLYGHVHNTYDELLINDYIYRTRKQKREIFGQEEPVSIPCQMINCFCMFSDYEPLSLEEWIEVDRKRREALWSGESS